MLKDELTNLEIVESERVFQGRVWDVRRETVKFGDGEIVRDFVDHTGAVAVLALDENDRVCLIRQYRHPVRAREWELPAGLLDLEGESPLIGAQRELAEEVDLVAADWSVLADFQTSPGGSNEALRIYLARGLSDAPEAFARTDEEAELEKHWASLDEIVDAVLARDVQNSILVIGALAAQASKARGWSTLAPGDAPWPRHPLFR
ncbi:NUDIX hydrolase [Glaciihabitans arcticus]|uniref:NUDIX hydrolase n=1 Tax=Glaciihabitans arcticus TaxID=2668039 RepID=A0A4V2JEQ2_9MICO|nr:NUDIX hydrolase [Glaciihabitans arcticus]TBN56489.1 NUDIX hydrolase [Glaciihabitans arcticus]